MYYKNQAIGESVLWWFRDEYWLHKSVQNIEQSLLNGTHHVFSEKVISVFLSRYSVRRTFRAGRYYENLFTEELVRTGFLKTIKDGKYQELDTFSSSFKSSSSSSIKSALSKFATLYNPYEFIMYDSRSKRGMYRLSDRLSNKFSERVTYNKIDSYSNYVDYAKSLSEEYDDETLKAVLSGLHPSKIKDFLLENMEAFKLRIVDKWLWLEGYGSEKPTTIKTSDYIKIINNEM